jgi:dTDP-L-rhamnose 4-epimerase
MATKTVLITGGAGFIGSHVANELLSAGYKVRALDSLIPQVHGPDRKRPGYLAADVELMVGDMRDPQALARALRRVDAVINLVALVGVGQSMYQIDEYTSVNNLGTAGLLQTLIRNPVERLLVASSMSIYGEGLYKDAAGVVQTPRNRTIEQLKLGDWEVRGPDNQPLFPIPTPEDKTPALASVYALSKFDQERLCLIVGGAYNIPTVALRFFNTYGPFQALSNPYTGVLSNFASRVLNGRPPLIFEDGRQLRDFISVYDIAHACRLALESPAAPGEVLNISNGIPMAVGDVAQRTVRALGRPSLQPEITGKYRMGDIRHCFADVSRAYKVLGWRPKVSLEQGLEDLAGWLEGQSAVDHGQEMHAELTARGLMV